MSLTSSTGPKIITIIGSLNMDLVTTTDRMPAGGETMHAISFYTGPGGKGGNQAVATARLSRPSNTSPSEIIIKMIGAVGSDDFGKSLIKGLKNDGIDTSGVKVREGSSTGIATIIVESKTGENRILVAEGANGLLLPEDFPSLSSLGTPLPDWIILQLEIPLETNIHVCKLAHTAGVNIIFNPAPAIPLPSEIYPLIHSLILNEGEAALLSGRTLEEVSDEAFDWSPVAEFFLTQGVKNVIITLGAKGAFIKSATVEGLVPTEKVEKIVDTTAAGDTFVGAYTVQMARQGNNPVLTKEVVVLASRAAGKTIQTAGAQNSIPWANKVTGFH